MDSLEGISHKPPSDDQTSYCRLCLSQTGMQVLSSASDLVQVIWKQLDIELTTESDDFPCAVCRTCVQKLEELLECNDDGWLNEWGDDGLLEYKKACQAVDLVIRNGRSAAETEPAEDTTIVLPFQQLADGRYKCKECPDLVFDEITACISHHQEIHLNPDVSGHESEAMNESAFDSSDALLSREEVPSATKRPRMGQNEPALNGNGSGAEKRPCFKCVTCGESYDNIDNLIQHRSNHEACEPNVTKIPKQRGKLKQFLIENNDTKCRGCNVEFPDKKAFYVHLNAIHDLNICNICDKSFSSASLLKNHQAYHRSLDDIINPFLLAKHSFHCKVCFDRFRTEREIRLHFQMKHADAENGSEDNGIIH